MSRSRLGFALVAVAAIALVGCGSDDTPTASAQGSTTSSAPAKSSSAGTVQLVETSLGEVLTDAHGMTLYLFMKDGGGKSACAGPCADTWPALTADGEPTAGKGVEEEDLGTMTRDDGSTQVTYYGKPLYHFKGDSKAGDVNGQGIGNVWFAVTAEGEKAGSAPAARSGY
jgi:predicted lipoprotein with Yx(FWY)xxD motif